MRPYCPFGLFCLCKFPLAQPIDPRFFSGHLRGEPL